MKILKDLSMNNIAWQPIEDHQDQEQFTTPRVVVFSPVYPEGHDMRYRILNTEFVRFCSDATHWAPLTPP